MSPEANNSSPEIFVHPLAIPRLQESEQLEILQNFVSEARERPLPLLNAIMRDQKIERHSEILGFLDSDPRLYKSISHDPQTLQAINGDSDVRKAVDTWHPISFSKDWEAEKPLLALVQKMRAVAFLRLALKSTTGGSYGNIN